ncbi:uncharacterized protein Z518_02636 [Rhinocladiella mackenziei CBS 650.93]|uniref:Zn(2)-C6 fungal-type domain-containing protein n=1 Tax=Rhinocladiella mackenziei CBS 650.93 TaxID=1442369 RepID=A0A0D2G0E8_9EURO|nr:uncharacterized protein Z518_02636 [Rhinocladiella mackenziei CBS 650.93]KIX07982.1 hypothetical protein Z518_02636 [Rhinocladiella mackenziei CBS 650.93]
MPSSKKDRCVPADLRKRALQSCDRCRKRRCKCVRDDSSTSCQSCLKSGSACLSTTPKRPRFYGTIDALNQRCHVLEAIVRHVCPHAEFETTRDLHALAKRIGCPLNDVVLEGPGWEEQGSFEPISTQIQTRNEDGHEAISNPQENDRLPLSTSRLQENQGPSSSRFHPESIDSSRLVSDSSGVMHYIGPSGSLSFFAQLRDLIQQRQPNARFASDNVAEALEVRRRASNQHSRDVSQTRIAEHEVTIPATAPGMDLYASLQDIGLRTLEDFIAIFFTKVHPNFPIFNRASFQEDLEVFLSSARVYAGDAWEIAKHNPEKQGPDSGWLVSLHMIVAFATLYPRPPDAFPGDVGQQNSTRIRNNCLKTARSHLTALAGKCVQSSLEALLLLALFLHNFKERNSAWMIVGSAIRIALAIGLHRNDTSTSFRPVEREARKRLWCTLYAFEQFLCMSLGRPSAIDDHEVDVSTPWDVLLDGLAPPAYMEQSHQLQRLLRKCRRNMPKHIPKTSQGQRVNEELPVDTITTVSIIEDLRKWETQLPHHLRPPNAKNIPLQQLLGEIRKSYCRYHPRDLRAIVLFHMQYHNIAILATRSILLKVIARGGRHEKETTTSSNNPSSAVSQEALSHYCVSSASHVAAMIIFLFESENLEGMTWLDVFYAYSAGMVLLLRILWCHQSQATVEPRIHSSLAQMEMLVGRLRQVLHQLRKCGTMERLSHVLEEFAEAVMTNSRARNGQPTAQAEQLGGEEQAPPPTEESRLSQHEFGDIDTQTSRAGDAANSLGYDRHEAENSRLVGSVNPSHIPWDPEAAHGPVHLNSAPDSSGPIVQNDIHGLARTECQIPPAPEMSMDMSEGELPALSQRMEYDFSPNRGGVGPVASRPFYYPDSGMDLSSTNESLIWTNPLEALTTQMSDWRDLEHYLGSMEDNF